MTHTPWAAFMLPHERAALFRWQRLARLRAKERLSDAWRWATWMP